MYLPTLLLLWHCSFLFSDWLWFVFQLSSETLCPNLCFFKVSWQSGGCGWVYTYGDTVFDGWFPVLSLAVANNSRSMMGACGCWHRQYPHYKVCVWLHRTHCKCFSKSLFWKLWCKISPTQLTESKSPRCCQLFLYFSTLFHIYTKIGQLIIWPEGWKNIPHRGGGGKCLSER